MNGFLFYFHTAAVHLVVEINTGSTLKTTYGSHMQFYLILDQVITEILYLFCPFTLKTRQFNENIVPLVIIHHRVYVGVLVLFQLTLYTLFKS